MNICIIIPVYNHEQAIVHVLSALKTYGVPCILVNDGSSAKCTEVLEQCRKQEADWLTLINRAQNGGKGAAVLDGIKEAVRLGYTHAIQIDADGQHEVSDIPKFTQASRENSDALILGQPFFDQSIPKGRLYGRQFTNLWICINTLSRAIHDGMCGFRLYPLSAVTALINSTQLTLRMDFDIDIVVRLYWQGIKVVNVPTQVSYPYDGVSHFKLWRDNLMISKIHARLFLGMLQRMPKLFMRHWQ